jgi:DNA-binding NarL/FixJ family response regulator
VVVIDDHHLVLEGLQLIIGRHPSLSVVGVATDGRSAVDVVTRLRPDVTLMDLQLPVMSGLEAIRQIKAALPSARIIVVTTYQGDENIYRALKAGATTYLLKDTLSKDLVRCITEVHEGIASLAPELQTILARRDLRPALTPRELDVMRLIARGLRNKEIAAILNISSETVQSHLKAIFTKLEVTDRTAAMKKALLRGIVDLTD